MAGGRRFLFLQGPAGPFFRLLGDELGAAGAGVRRINLSPGDVVDWPAGHVFRGRPSEWASFVETFAREHGVTDLVVYNDTRYYHAEAIRVLRRQGVEIHVFEEGYLRPDWITCQRDGVNGNSPLDARALIALADTVPVTPSHTVGRSTPTMGWRYFGYYLVTALLRPFFPHYRCHRRFSMYREAWAWLRRLVTLPVRRRTAHASEKELWSMHRPYFLLPLQIEGDSQITVHSRFDTIENVIDTVIRSFAYHAPAEHVLAVKNHPLDSGVVDHEATVRTYAQAYGIADRVLFVDGGHLPDMIAGCSGVVTVNSTAGVSALHRHVPTCVLGNAIYDAAGLTHQSGLDAFWRVPEAPDSTTYERFRKGLRELTQLNGSFYTRHGRDLALPLCRRKLLSGTPTDLLVNAPATGRRFFQESMQPETAQEAAE